MLYDYSHLLFFGKRDLIEIVLEDRLHALYEHALMASALFDAASSRSAEYFFPRLRIPMQDLNPCSGCCFADMIVSTSLAVHGPVFSAQL